MVKDWKAKVHMGYDYVKRIKLKNPQKFQDLKIYKIDSEVRQSKKISKIPTLKSLRDLYFS
jgi:hypothetical protein